MRALARELRRRVRDELRSNMATDTVCPVCGYELGFEAWKHDSPSDEICLCCGIQFGYDDILPDRAAIHWQWRERWIADGCRWWSRGRPAPSGWDPRRQLARLAK